VRKSISPQILLIQRKIEQEFADIPRPQAFTDSGHCCECADHNKTLSNFSPATISFTELGNPGWDPVCFMTDEAFKYFFPAFCRLAASSEGETWYLDQFLFHLAADGKRNSRWQSFSTFQRELVREYLEILLEANTEKIEFNCSTDLFLEALEIWSDKE